MLDVKRNCVRNHTNVYLCVCEQKNEGPYLGAVNWLPNYTQEQVRSQFFVSKEADRVSGELMRDACL